MPRYTHEFYNQKLHVHCSRNQGHLQVRYEQFVIHRTFFCLYIVLNFQHSKYHDIFNTIMLLLVRIKKKNTIYDLHHNFFFYFPRQFLLSLLYQKKLWIIPFADLQSWERPLGRAGCTGCDADAWACWSTSVWHKGRRHLDYKSQWTAILSFAHESTGNVIGELLTIEEIVVVVVVVVNLSKSSNSTVVALILYCSCSGSGSGNSSDIEASRGNGENSTSSGNHDNVGIVY